MGPDAPLHGRNLGQDFAQKDGWNMYHGSTVPGFPAHPHRGFETVTIVRKGLIDHSDSLGAAARFGMGDVQWLTAGAGIQHSEMFPLLNRDGPNTTELFQIWLNLPARSKLVKPHFSIFWGKNIPSLEFDGGRVSVIAGELPGASAKPLSPPPESWASAAESDVAIWTITMRPGASWTVPAAKQASTRRVLYVFEGTDVKIAGKAVSKKTAVEVRSDVPITIETSSSATDILMLQGRPIGEPVAQRGPFVMNTQQELMQAFMDYQKTEFGGWPWPSEAPVHPREAGRFAKYVDGTVEQAE